jgi:hypothetical protein
MMLETDKNPRCKAQLNRERENVRIFFIVSFLAKLILTLISLAVLPERVAIHLGHGGVDDNYVRKNCLLLAAFALRGRHSVLSGGDSATKSRAQQNPISLTDV